MSDTATASAGTVEPIFLDVPNTARVLSLSTRKIYDLIYAGHLDSAKVEGSRRVYYSSVKAYAESLRKKA